MRWRHRQRHAVTFSSAPIYLPTFDTKEHDMAEAWPPQHQFHWIPGTADHYTHEQIEAAINLARVSGLLRGKRVVPTPKPADTLSEPIWPSSNTKVLGYTIDEIKDGMDYAATRGWSPKPKTRRASVRAHDLKEGDTLYRGGFPIREITRDRGLQSVTVYVTDWGSARYPEAGLVDIEIPA